MNLRKSAVSLAVVGMAVSLPTFGGLNSANAATYNTDFSTIGATTAYTGPYSDGGITVQYVGITNGIWTTSQPTAPSGYSWYSNGGGTGYTDITLTGGGTFTSASLLVGSGFGGGSPQLDYKLLNGTTVVSSGDWGSVPSYGGGLITASFSGGPFTEIQIQGPLSSTIFSPTNFEALALGSITLFSAVPEPSTWAMMILGFFGVGFMAYRRKSKPAFMAA